MGSLRRRMIRRMRLQGVATLTRKRGVLQPQISAWIEGAGGYRELGVGLVTRRNDGRSGDKAKQGSRHGLNQDLDTAFTRDRASRRGAEGKREQFFILLLFDKRLSGGEPGETLGSWGCFGDGERLIAGDRLTRKTVSTR